MCEGVNTHECECAEVWVCTSVSVCKCACGGNESVCKCECVQNFAGEEMLTYVCACMYVYTSTCMHV